MKNLHPPSPHDDVSSHHAGFSFLQDCTKKPMERSTRPLQQIITFDF